MTWETCMKTNAEEVIVVTDSDEIFELISNLGGSAYRSEKNIIQVQTESKNMLRKQI